MVPVPPPWVKSSITWLLVITSPLDVMIMPVPSSSLPCDLTSMETTAGMTFLTNSGMVTFPLSTAAPGSERSLVDGDGVVVVAVVGQRGDAGADPAADEGGDDGDADPGAAVARIRAARDGRGRREDGGGGGGASAVTVGHRRCGTRVGRIAAVDRVGARAAPGVCRVTAGAGVAAGPLVGRGAVASAIGGSGQTAWRRGRLPPGGGVGGGSHGGGSRGRSCSGTASTAHRRSARPFGGSGIGGRPEHGLGWRRTLGRFSVICHWGSS